MKCNTIVDTAPLAGKSNKSIKQAHLYAKQFSTKESKLSFLRQNAEQSFLLSYDVDLIPLFNKTETIYVTVPNISQYVRDLNNYGLVMMGLRKLLHIGFDLPFLLPVGLSNCLGVFKKDMGSILSILTEIEMLKLKRLKPKVVFLHPQMTDLFLANNNPEPLRTFLTFVKKRYRVDAGLFTNNVVLLLSKLEQWKISVKYICTPINPRGYLMKPSKQEAEQAIRNSSTTFFAYDSTCGNTIPVEEAEKYIQQLGLKTMIVETT